MQEQLRVAVNKMPCKIITMFLIVGMVSIHCYPINKEGRCSTTYSAGSSQVIMSNTVRDLLVSVSNATTSNEGLTELYLSATYLVINDELYVPEVMIANCTHACNNHV